MSQRPGVQLTVHNPVHGGEYPNRYLPRVSAHVRAYWPAHVTLNEILDTLQQAHDQAERAIMERWMDARRVT